MYSSQSEHQDRPKLPVLSRSDDQFKAPALFLHHNSIELFFGAIGPKHCDDFLEGLPYLSLTFQGNPYSSGLGLMYDVGRGNLERYRKPHAGGHTRGLILILRQGACEHPQAFLIEKGDSVHPK